jgi:hypothetical protein
VAGPEASKVEFADLPLPAGYEVGRAPLVPAGAAGREERRDDAGAVAALSQQRGRGDRGGSGRERDGYGAPREAWKPREGARHPSKLSTARARRYSALLSLVDMVFLRHSRWWPVRHELADDVAYARHLNVSLNSATSVEADVEARLL